jgi:hypothetical protein
MGLERSYRLPWQFLVFSLNFCFDAFVFWFFSLCSIKVCDIHLLLSCFLSQSDGEYVAIKETKTSLALT